MYGESRTTQNMLGVCGRKNDAESAADAGGPPLRIHSTIGALED
jgi:hypothetical protein